MVFAAGSQYWYLTKENVGIQAQDGTIHSADNMMTKNPPTGTFGLNHGNNDNNDLPDYLSAVRMLNTAGTGTLISIELLVNDTTPKGNVHIGMYEDDNGKPGTLLVDAGETPVVSGWTKKDGLSVAVTKGDYYWFAYNISALNTVRYQTNRPPDSNRFVEYDYNNGLPTMFPGSSEDNRQVVMKGTVEINPSATSFEWGYAYKHGDPNPKWLKMWPIGEIRGDAVTAWWYSESQALTDVAFGDDNWFAELFYKNHYSKGTLWAEVWSINPDGSTDKKLAVGSESVSWCDGYKQVIIQCNNESGTQMVPQGNWLALKLWYDPDDKFQKDWIIPFYGSTCFPANLQSPPSDPGFPMPELPAIILLEGGFGCLALYIVIRQAREKSHIRKS